MVVDEWKSDKESYVYSIKTNIVQGSSMVSYVVWRRYTDFDILQEYLLLFSPALAYPIPEKSYALWTTNALLDYRKNFFNNVVKYLSS